jgi:hypothetical protein
MTFTSVLGICIVSISTSHYGMNTTVVIFKNNVLKGLYVQSMLTVVFSYKLLSSLQEKLKLMIRSLICQFYVSF